MGAQGSCGLVRPEVVCLKFQDSFIRVGDTPLAVVAGNLEFTELSRARIIAEVRNSSDAPEALYAEWAPDSFTGCPI